VDETSLCPFLPDAFARQTHGKIQSASWKNFITSARHPSGGGSGLNNQAPAEFTRGQAREIKTARDNYAVSLCHSCQRSSPWYTGTESPTDFAVLSKRKQVPNNCSAVCSVSGYGGGSGSFP
jgi:hypothetical protein